MKAATAEGPARAPARSEGRAREASGHSTEAGFAGEMLMLQRHAGNMAVGRMLAGIPGGSGERQANAVADRFVGRRARTEHAWLTIGSTAPRDVPASVVDAIGMQGHALEPGVRSTFEHQIGTTLGSVHIHTDARAAASARDLGARAYTYGPHVVFGPGRFAPSSAEGRHLLAHELTHVAQQRGRPPVLQLAPDDGSGPAPAGSPGGDLVKAAILSRLGDLTLPPLGLRLAVDAGRGMGEEIITELKGAKGVALLAHIKSFTYPNVQEVQQGFGVGLLSGILSPVTDLFGLVVLAERVRNFLFGVLANPMSARDGLAEDVNALLLEIGKLKGSAAEAWKEITKSPRDALIFILKLPDKLSEEAEAKAYDLGKSGGAAVVDSLLQPFGEGTPEKKEEEPKLSLATVASYAESLGKRGKDFLVGPSPWAKIGEKVGYALGWVAIQVILLAFTDGIGDAIQWLAQGLGKIATALGKISEVAGRVAAKVAEAAKAIGEAIAFVEEWFGKILAKLLKPAEKFLEPLLKQLEGVRTKLRAVLEKLFGITRKEGEKLAETAAVKAAKATGGAVDDALERAAPKGGSKVAPEPKPRPPEPPPGEGRAAGAVREKPPEPIRDKPPEVTGEKPPEPVPEKPPEAASEAVKGGHHVEATPEGIELCSPNPCPLLGVVYRKELQANEELATRLAAVEKLRLTDPKAAAKAAADLRETLEFIRSRPSLFGSLPSHVTPQQQVRLAELLRRAEDTGVRLGEQQVREIAGALGQAKDAGAVTDLLDAVEARLGQVSDPFADAGSVGGGSREGDPATELPGGTHGLGKELKNPTEVADFLHRHPKVKAAPDSEGALDALFEGQKSALPERTPWHGRSLPTRTGGAEGELASIEELSLRKEVEEIELVPSSTEGRTTDKILTVRQPDGTLQRVRYEDTAIVGSKPGAGKSTYRPLAEPRLEATVDDIEAAVTRKVTSTPGRPSQFDAFMVDVPQGGILAVHVQTPSPTPVQDIADAMRRLQSPLRASSVDSVEFYLPGQRPLRYVRAPDGSFNLLGAPVSVGAQP